MKARRAVFREYGDPDVIEWEDTDLGAPGSGDAIVRQTAIGLNFIDTYHRRGIYPVELPSGLGLEAAGVVEALGDGATGLAPGDRVVTFGPRLGAYATARTVPADSLFAIPKDVDDATAAAAFLKGCTAEFLIERCARVEPGWPVLVHAAAGGVGQILVQWLKHLGAYVIGTASSADKAAKAKARGADEIIDYTRGETAERVRELTGGEGVRVTFDGVGQSTWEASLAATARRGLLVSFGNAGGPVEGVGLGILARHGSLFVTRPTLFDYYAVPSEARAGAARVFDLIARGVLTIEIGQRYPLEQAAQAHRDLEARKTLGSTILEP